MKSSLVLLLAIFLAPAAFAENRFPLAVGAEVSGPGACPDVARSIAVQDYDARYPHCFGPIEQYSTAEQKGEEIDVTLAMLGGGGHTSCGGADGYYFTVIRAGAACTLRFDGNFYN